MTLNTAVFQHLGYYLSELSYAGHLHTTTLLGVVMKLHTASRSPWSAAALSVSSSCLHFTGEHTMQNVKPFGAGTGGWAG